MSFLLLFIVVSSLLVILSFCLFSLKNMYKIPIILSHLLLLPFILLLHTVRSPGRCLLYTFTGRYNNIYKYFSVSRISSQYDGKQARGITVERNVFDPGKSLAVHWKESVEILNGRIKKKKGSVLKWKLSKNDLWSWGYFLFVGRKFSFYFCSSVLFYNRNI